MEQYFLQPGWEIIPCESGAELIPLKNNRQPLFLRNDPEFPTVVGLFEALRKGIAVKSALPSYKKLLAKLVKLGVVAIQSKKENMTKSSNYLDLLCQNFVGPDNIVHSLSTISETKNLTIAEAVGLGARFIQHQPSLNYGWGADSSSLMARIKAVVECVERFALSNYDQSTFRRATWRGISKNSLTAKQLNTTDARLENAGAIECGELKKLNGDGFIYAPLDFLHHPVDYWSLGRLPVCPMDISGVAGHQTKEAATVNALLELCEHEALMVTWFSQRVSPTIKPESLDPESQKYIELLKKMGWKVILKDISLDLVPVVMAIGLGPKNKRALTIGSNAAFTAKYAAKKAILEVARTIIQEEVKGAKPTLVKSEDVNDVISHSQYYADHENLRQAEHLWMGGKEVEASDHLTYGNFKNRDLAEVAAIWEKDGKSENHELKYLTGLLTRAGLDIYVSNLTPKEVCETDVPLVIMRAVVPEMTRLVVGYDQKPAQTVRFKKHLKKFGKINAKKIPKIHAFS